MNALRSWIRALPGVRGVRRALEHVATPTVKADIARIEADVGELREIVEALEQAIVNLLSVVSQTSGNLELLRHELSDRREHPMASAGDDATAPTSS